ncbi:MAG: hypothetical protein HXS54_13100 [Theionarchaea archaeon]|nr:hypothetical protein [Theionarchaea archaeon]
MIIADPVSSGGFGGSSDDSSGGSVAVNQVVAFPGTTPPISPPPYYSSVASISIIDHLPNSAGSKYLIHNGTCIVNTICIYNSAVSCDFGGGIEILELIALIHTEKGYIQVRDTCYFYVDCGQGASGNTDSSQPTSQSPPPNPEPTCHDYDGDGYSNCDGDCNDYDSTVYPEADDLCDEDDNDCDREVDEDCLESMISLEVSPESASIGKAVNVSGLLSPSRTANIHLVFTRPDDTMFSTVANSNEEGIFSFSFVPESSGTWSVSALAEGSSIYRSAASDRVFFSVKKIKTTLSLRLSSALLYPLEEIRISGVLLPAMTTDITITIEDEKGHKEKKVVSSMPDGTFSLSHEPASVGIWSVSAMSKGNQNYESANSSTHFFTVAKEESAISISVSSENEEIIEGNTIQIIGQIRPQRSTTIFIYLENERGAELSFQVLSKEDGTFSEYFTPESAGMWSAYAYVSEDATYTSVRSDIFSFLIESAIPDLAISNLVVHSPSAEPDEKIGIYFEVENQGTGTAEKVIICIIAYSETSETTIYEKEVDRISAGNWMSINVSWVAYLGVDTLIIEIDPLNRIQELREDNNDSIQEMDISFKEDISVKGIRFSSEELIEGETVAIIAQIQCKGDVSSCWIEFWDGRPGTGSKIVTKVLQSLSEETSIEVYWTPEQGNHSIFVSADPLNRVPESDESNNILETDVTVEKTPPPIAETGTLIAVGASAAAYLHWRKTGHSISRRGKHTSRRVSQRNPRVSDKSLRQGTRVPTGAEPAQALASYPNSSNYYPYICKAKDFLLKAGATSAANEIGAKLYKTLYSRNYHWNKAQPVDFERTVQYKLDLLEKVIAHLYVFEGYIDTEEFCRFFNTDEVELLEVLDFLYTNGYIERINT